MIGRHGDRAVLFRDVSVFDGTGADALPRLGARARQPHRHGRARALTRSTHPTPRSSTGAAATLMPGLVEGHAHLTWPSSIERVVNAMTLPIEEHMLTTAVNARITLDAGFTSAYSAGALGERMEVALRDQIDGGHLPGPTACAASALEKGDGGCDGRARGPRPDSRPQHLGPAAVRPRHGRSRAPTRSSS